MFRIAFYFPGYHHVVSHLDFPAASGADAVAAFFRCVPDGIVCDYPVRVA